MQETTSQRPRSSSTIHVPQEVYNVPSQERLDLISEFREVTGKESVSAAFWAFLFVCDLSKLRELVEHARSGISIPYLNTLERTFFFFFFPPPHRPALIHPHGHPRAAD